MTNRYPETHPVAIYIYAYYVRYHYIDFGYYIRYDINVNDIEAFKAFEENLYNNLTTNQKARMTKLIINTPSPANGPLVIGEDLEPEYEPLMYLKTTDDFIRGIRCMA